MFKIDIENTSDLNAAIPPLKEVILIVISSTINYND